LITITRRLAGQLKTVFRQALRLSPRANHPPVLIASGPAGLSIRCRTREAAAEYATSDTSPEETLAVPFELLADIEGRREEPVRLERRDGQIVAQWQDREVPQVVQHNVPDKTADNWPLMPEQFAENPSNLLQALDDACRTTDPDSVRFALGCVQLRGGTGKIAATDGRQLLVQSGFTFPWQDDIVVPTSKVFGSKGLPHDEPVLVGRTEDWFTVRVAQWTFHFAINKEGRFPRIEDHLPRPGSAIANVELTPADREFLLENLPRLPADDLFDSPVTLDLNGRVAIRAKDPCQSAVTELVLSESTPTGEPIRINMNRKYLARAARLGLDRLHVFSPSTPVLACDGRRQYVWALLAPESAMAPTGDAAPGDSTDGAAHAVPAAVPSAPPGNAPSTIFRPRRRKRTTMSTKRSTNGQAEPTTEKPEDPGVAALIEQAESLRTSLRDSLAKTCELIASLKRHRRQSRLVASTLASLKRLQTIDA
jgi:hypothetical protein